MNPLGKGRFLEKEGVPSFSNFFSPPQPGYFILLS
jgi:hypothetical protein